MFTSSLPEIIDTLSKSLCSKGLIEKGLFGELAARLLLLIARDSASIQPTGLETRTALIENPPSLQPVSVLSMLNALFGGVSWAGLHQSHFDKAFGTAYVNFTHWILTMDPLPQEPSP
jgi:hypothetical protein